MAGIPGCRSRFLHQLGTGLFIIFPPPPYTFFNSNNLQSFAILFVYFSPGRKCKNTLPLPVKAKKGCFMPSDGRGGAASQTKSFRMGVKMSSRMPASVQTQPCSTPSSFRMVSPALTVWVTPSTVNSKAPDTT